MKENNSERLSILTKVGFGVGDIYGGGAMMIVGFYYLYFLTDVVGIDPRLAGIAFLVSKVWDAVSDPLMGYISDRTRSRFGRRRPYFLAGVVLIFASFFMMWYPVDFALEMHRFAFVMAGYLFFSTVITMVMIPYNALASELTLDYNERTSLTTFRMFFSSVSSLLCAVLPMEIVKLFPNARSGYVAMGVVIGIFFALPFIMTFFTTRERPEFQKEQARKNIFKIFTDPFKTPTFLHVLMMYLLAFVAIDMVMSIVIYFMTYYIGRGEESNYVLGTLMVMQIISLPFYYKLSKKTSKKKGYIFAMVIWILVLLTSLFIGPGVPRYVIYVFGAVLGVGTGGVVIMIYSIFPDVPDVDELYSKERREGIYSGIYTFMRKLGSAVGLFFISNAIAFAGYKKPVREVVDGMEKMVQQEQSDEFILMLRIIFVALPIIFISIALIVAFSYPLTPELHGRLKTFLEKRRSGEGGDRAEEEYLDKTLRRKS